MAFPSALRLAAFATAIVALTLGGCGRRGALEPATQPGAQAHKATDESRDQRPATDPVDGTRRARNITPLKEPFALDPLL